MFSRVLATMAAVVTGVAVMSSPASAEPAPAALPTSSFAAPLAAPMQPAAAGQVLVRQRATLTSANRVAGQPVPAARWRIDRATIDVEVLSSLFADVTVSLGSTANHDGDAHVAVMFGHRDSAGSCNPAAGQSETTSVFIREHDFFGSAPGAWGPKPSRPWECVIVATNDGASNPDNLVVHDMLIGWLSNTYEAPKLKVGAVKVLGQKQKKLKISKGGWTPVQVTIANRGTRAAGRITLRGKGKGLKVKAGSLSSLRHGSSATAVVRVKPVGRKKPKKLVLTAKAAGGVVAKRAVKVKQVKLPKKPRAGRYRSPDGTVKFRIRKGRVTGFSVTTQTQCGGYGTTPTHTQNTYDFPKRKIPRNGILTASAKGKAHGVPWSSSLQMRVDGAKITRAVFRYNGPGGCSATDAFKAKRVGR